MKKVLFFCMLVTLLVACSKPSESERSVFKYTTISNSKIEFSEKRLGDGIRLVSNRYDKNEQCFIAVFEPVFDQKIDAVYAGMFAYCTDLKSVVIPSGIKTIYSASFAGCSGLESITIPESVTDIKAFAFNECDLYISDLSAWCKIGHSSLPIIYSHGDDDTEYMYDHTPISYRLFLNGEMMTELVIPDSIKEIKYCAFKGCSSLTKVIIPDCVTGIGERAFENCNKLTCVVVPESVTSIGECAFDGTAWLQNQPDGVVYAGNVLYGYRGEMPENTSITIADGTLSITAGAFAGCDGLTSIEIPNSVTNIGDDAFYGTAWYNNQPDGVVYAGNVLYGYRGEMPENTLITIADGTLGIAAGAFSGCGRLTSVTIPNSVTNIGFSAFGGCSGLTSVTIPNSVTNIGALAFEDCTSLTSIEIPNSVISIGNYAFCGCSGLTSVTIPNSVTNIGARAFEDCTSLTSIEIPNSVISIGERAFWKCSGLTSIVIGNSVTNIGERAFDYCTGLESIKVESGNTVYDSRENCNAIIETETDCMFVYCKNTVVPFGIERFISCSNCKFSDLQWK